MSAEETSQYQFGLEEQHLYFREVVLHIVLLVEKLSLNINVSESTC